MDAGIAKYLTTIGNRNKNSEKAIRYYLRDFETFCRDKLETTDKQNPVSEVIGKLKAGTWNGLPKEEAPYDVLGQYAAWLVGKRLEDGSNNARNVKYKLSWARTLFEFNFIAISKVQYKLHVKTPTPEDPDLSPIDKRTVANIIRATSDIRMQSYVMFLATRGMRATESLTMTVGNLENFDINTLKFTGTPFVKSSGRHGKTKKGMRRQLTNEMARQIESLLAHNYRKRRIHHKINGKWVNRTHKPIPKPTDPLFSAYHSEVSEHTKRAQAGKISKTHLENLYDDVARRFRQTTDRLGIKWEDEAKRRSVTLHSLRRFCFTTCARVNGEGYAKYHLGRKTHEYKKDTEAQLAEDFAKVEPYLTILDASGVEIKQKALEKEIEDIKKRLERVNGLGDL
jgi:hypothetical protein